MSVLSIFILTPLWFDFNFFSAKTYLQAPSSLMRDNKLFCFQSPQISSAECLNELRSALQLSLLCDLQLPIGQRPPPFLSPFSLSFFIPNLPWRQSGAVLPHRDRLAVAAVVHVRAADALGVPAAPPWHRPGPSLRGAARETPTREREMRERRKKKKDYLLQIHSSFALEMNSQRSQLSRLDQIDREEGRARARMKEAIAMKSLVPVTQGGLLTSHGLHLVLSGIINGLLFFVFCCVYSTLVFRDYREGEDIMKNFLPVGMEMYLFSVMFGSFMFAWFSHCPAAIAGPDVNATVFLALIFERIQLGPNGPGDLPPAETVIPTCLFAVVFSTFLIGSTFYLLGAYNLTRIVQYLPATLLNGFLACIGYKILRYALQTACGEVYYLKPWTFTFWKLILPALPMGFGLYFSKAYGIGKPAVSITLLLLAPLVIFYTCLITLDVSMETAREECPLDLETECEGGWFFPEFSSGSSIEVYKAVDFKNIDFSLWASSLNELPAMLIVVVIDFMLNLAGNKRALGEDFPFDHEMKTAGKACLVNACFGVSFTAYSQAKFTELNYGIAHDKRSRIPAVVCGLFNAVLFFWGFPLINYLPRFFLAGLLIYAGIGFIVDNLIKSYARVSKEEFVAIWVVVIVNAIISLFAAVIVGIVLSALIFAVSYGRVGVVKAFIRGCDFESRVVRSVGESSRLVHFSKRYAIVQMQNYIFFGSAGQFLELVKKMVKEQEKHAKVQRIKYLIFDWADVYGIDFSGIGVISEVVALLRRNDVYVIFTAVESKIYRSLLRENVIQSLMGIFDSLDLGVEFVEEELLEWYVLFCVSTWSWLLLLL